MRRSHSFKTFISDITWGPRLVVLWLTISQMSGLKHITCKGTGIWKHLKNSL